MGNHLRHGPQDPTVQQPRDKQVESLKRVEPHHAVFAELLGSQHDDGSNPADPRDVTADGSRARRDLGERVGGRRRRAHGLTGAAPAAIDVTAVHLVPALAAKRHLFLHTLFLCKEFTQPERSRGKIFAMRPLYLWILLLALAASLPAAKNLEVYFIDVEGGQSTLFVSPSGETLLMDAGYGGFNGRD